MSSTFLQHLQIKHLSCFAIQRYNYEQREIYVAEKNTKLCLFSFRKYPIRRKLVS